MRVSALRALAAALLGALASGCPGAPTDRFGGASLAVPGQATPGGPTVLFVVLDTVRADRLSLCGYPRPTSPTLERLRELGARYSCRAYAPGDWTLPSHASFFTGTPVAVHGAHITAPAQGDSEWRNPTRDLRADLPTLAELFRERGYQTALVSGNPMLRRLSRGFEHEVTERWMRGAELLDELDRLLVEDLDRSGPPLFLTVNLFDAHDPWAGVPEGLPWAPERGRVEYAFAKGCPEGDPWRSYVREEMPPEERAHFLAQLGDVYDYGVWSADEALGELLRRLEAWGWLDAGLRLVVTSDHGEFLGEHGLLTHGLHLYEENQRVPLLVYDTSGAPELPEPVSALVAYHLVRDGALPDPLPPVQAVAFPAQVQARCSEGRMGTQLSAAEWGAAGERHWIDGQRYESDGGPERRAPSDPEDPVWRRLDALAGAARRSFETGSAMDPEMLEALRAVGYAE